MALQSRSEAVINLGKRLAAQLSRDDDIASNWLSHLVAERLVAIEEATTPEAKLAAESNCTVLVFELWRHQGSFSKDVRPFRDLDSVLRTLELLDVDRTSVGYYPLPFRMSEEEALPKLARKWLDFALGVDTTAREIIRMALGKSLLDVGESMQEWVALARGAATDEPVESVVVRFLVDDHEQDDVSFVQEQRQKRLDRLKDFIKLAETLVEDLETELPLSNKVFTHGGDQEQS